MRGYQRWRGGVGEGLSSVNHKISGYGSVRLRWLSEFWRGKERMRRRGEGGAPAALCCCPRHPMQASRNIFDGCRSRGPVRRLAAVPRSRCGSRRPFAAAAAPHGCGTSKRRQVRNLSDIICPRSRHVRNLPDIICPRSRHKRDLFDIICPRSRQHIMPGPSLILDADMHA